MKKTNLSKTKQKKKVAIFIDDANLFYAQKRLGWKISWERLKHFLERSYYLKYLNYYLGEPPSKEGKEKHEAITEKLFNLGYKVKSKKLKKIIVDKRKNRFVFKCNFDVEIALDVAHYINEVDHIIIVSGDSDFLPIKDFCLKRNKTFSVLCFEDNVAWEIRKIHHLFLETIKNSIIKNKPTISRG